MVSATKSSSEFQERPRDPCVSGFLAAPPEQSCLFEYLQATSHASHSRIWRTNWGVCSFATSRRQAFIGCTSSTQRVVSYLTVLGSDRSRTASWKGLQWLVMAIVRKGSCASAACCLRYLHPHRSCPLLRHLLNSCKPLFHLSPHVIVSSNLFFSVDEVPR